MPVNAFGIDLGTSNIKIYNGITDTIARYKNMIAVQKMQNHKTVMAYGDEAFEMYVKSPRKHPRFLSGHQRRHCRDPSYAAFVASLYHG